MVRARERCHATLGHASRHGGGVGASGARSAARRAAAPRRADVVLVKAPSRAPPCHARRGQRRGAARRRSPLTGTCAATVPRRGPSRRAEQSAGAASQGNPRQAGPRRLPVPLQPAPGDAPCRAVRWRTRGLYRRAGGVCGPRTGSVLRCRGGGNAFWCENVLGFGVGLLLASCCLRQGGEGGNLQARRRLFYAPFSPPACVWAL